jgi:hypothetical protein
MHAFAEIQKSTHTAAPVNLSAKREQRGFMRHSPSYVNGASHHEREADAAADELMRTIAPSAKTEATTDSRGDARMPGEVRSFFESRYGHDLSSVRLHHDGAAAESAKALDARAYTVGRDVVFGAGEYRPHTAEGKRLLAHELAHVVQQRGPTHGDAAGATRPGGNVPRLSPLSSPSIQRQTAAPPGQATPTRVTTSDEYERYQAAQEKMESFRSGAPYFLHNYKPSTGRGFFDAMYYPPNLYITVKVGFYFIDSDLDWWQKNGKPDAKAEDVKWTDAEREAWRQRYLTDVSAKWTNEKFLLFCTRPWWENLTAQVVVRFTDVEKSAPEGLGLGKGDVKSHYDLIIKKIPKGESQQSYTSSPTGKSEKEGSVTLNSEGLTRARNESGNSQRSAVHESAHMLGLGDTYVPDDKHADATTEASHAALAKKDAGVDIPIKDDARLTSRGEEMDSTDSVTFLEAMRKTTRIPEWALAPKPAARAPYAPERINDGVAPRETIA